MKTMIRFSLKSATRKELTRRLQQVFQTGDMHKIKRITALLWLADGLSAPAVVEQIGVSHTSFASHRGVRLA